MSKLLAKMGRALLLSEQELMKLIRSAPRRYKVYQIPKRKPGQFRTIAQPAKEVKALQYWVIDNFLRQFPVHPSATAYRRGHGLIDNVRPHRKSRFLLKLDFANFFPSIRARDFTAFLENHDSTLEENDAEALTQILFWKPKGTRTLLLSIGAPSSPLLSNLLLHDFDQHVHSFCSKQSIVYTRYADDMSFSTDSSSKLKAIERFVMKQCKEMRRPKLKLNSDKLVRVSKKTSRRITGLVITNDQKVSLGRDKKRELRASVHHFALGRLSDVEALQLKGMLAYVNAVEPSFLSRLRDRYGAEVITRIQKR